MAQIHWTNQVSDLFSKKADWSGDKVPGAADDAVLDAPGTTAYTVTSNANQTVLGIQTASTATLDITAGAFSATKGTDGGVNAGAILVGDAAKLVFAGTVDNTGMISLASGGDATSLLVGAGGLTLTGKGHVTLGDSTANTITNATVTSLTNFDNTIAGAGLIGGSGLTLANQGAGVIEATGTNALTLSTGKNVTANAGLIEAAGTGGLVIRSAVANTGTLEGLGAGALAVTGATVSGAGTVTAAKGGHVSLAGGAIGGGTVSIAAGGVLSADTGGTSTASAIAAATFVNAGQVAINDAASLTLAGTVANGGTISVDSGGDATGLVVGAAGVWLTGVGKLVLGDNTANTLSGASAAATLTNVSNTIAGAGQLGTGKMTLVNQAKGVVDATGANALILSTGSSVVTNQGLIEATGTGGLTIMSTTVSNGATGVIAAGAGSPVKLQGATVAGGTLKTVGTGAIDVIGGATFDGTSSQVVASGVVDVADASALTLEGNLLESGVINLASGGDLTEIIVAKTTAINGFGKIVLSDSTANAIVGGASAVTLTDQAAAITGAGVIGSSTLTLSLGTGAVVEATGANVLFLATGKNTIANAGLIEAVGIGGLSIQSAVNNSGTLKGLGTGALAIDGATVSGAGTVTAAKGGHVSLQGGAISGGTVSIAAGGLLSADAGGPSTASAVAAATFVNAGKVEVSDATSLTLAGTVANGGTISVDSGGDATSLVVGAAGLTLTGAGKLVLGDNAANTLSGASAAATLTNVSNTIAGAGQLGAGKMTLVNQAKGVIDAVGANALILSTGSSAVTNQGLIEATGAGGLTVLSTTIDQAGGALAVNGGDVSLQGATIVGGTLKAAGKGGFFVAAASTLDGSTGSFGAMTNQATLTVDDAATLSLAGSIINQDVIALASGGDATDLAIAKNTVLSGAGKVTLSDSAANAVVGGGSATLLDNVDNTIAGAGTIGSSTLSLLNQAKGVIDAVGANALVLSTGGAVTNQGLIEATGTGGLTILNTTVRQSGGSLFATGGNVSLQGASIVGGTLKGAGAGGFFAATAGSTLDGSTGSYGAVTNQATITVDDGVTLSLAGSIINDAVFALASSGDATALAITRNVTLSGGGKLTLSDEAGANAIVGGATATVLTNVNDTISGAGTIGSATLTFANQAAGVVDATGANVLTLDTGKNVTTNAGLMEATGAGGLTIASALTNSGELEAVGAGALTLAAAVTSTAGGSLVIAKGGHLSFTGGSLTGGALDINAGATLSVDAAAGSALAPASVTNAGTIIVNDAAKLTLQGPIDNTGFIEIATSGDATELVVAAAGLTLTGAGQFTLTDKTANEVTGATAAATLTNVDNTISGAGQLGGGQMKLVNQSKGVIDATGSNALILSAGTTNTGLIEATSAGGLTILNSGVLNTGGIILANGGAVSLANSTIQGGTLQTTGSSVIQTVAGAPSLLNGGALQGTLRVVDASALDLFGAIANSGTIDVESGGDVTYLEVLNGGATVSGIGVVLLGDNVSNIITGQSAAATLTNGGIIQGAGVIGNGQMGLVNEAGALIESGTKDTNGLIVNTGTTYFVNDGTMEAVGTGGLTIEGHGFNSAAIEAASGSVLTFNTAGIGNGGGTITALTGGTVVLTGAVIGDGVLATQASGVMQIGAGSASLLEGYAGGTLSNQGAVTVLDGAILQLAGPIANSGAIALAATSSSTVLQIAKAGATLSGGGEVTLGDNTNSEVTGVTATATLTNVDNTISGAGNVGGGALTLINQAKGVIDATSADTALVIATGAGTLTNQGLIEATGAGGLTFSGATVVNFGSIFANGGDVTLSAAIVAGGVLNSLGSSAFKSAGAQSELFALENTGQVDVVDSTDLWLGGAIQNAGSITMMSTGGVTDLVIANPGATLTGSGVVLLGDNANNGILAGAKAATLTNDSRISGGGFIGDATLTLVNQAGGQINSGSTQAGLLIDTGSNTVTNAGLIEALGQGGLILKSSVANTGTLEAGAGSNLWLESDFVTDTGSGVVLAVGGVVKLFNGGIDGGTLTGSGGGSFQTYGAGANELSSLTNTGTVTVTDGTSLALEGPIHNTGQIDLASAGAATVLGVSTAGVTLTGGGQVTLGDNANNDVIGLSSAATLVNVDNTVSGAGDLGSGQLVLINDAAGVIDATGTGILLIDTGANTILNAGLIENTGKGGLEIKSGVTNTGTIENAATGLMILDALAVNNVGGTILANGGTIGLMGATIDGGTLASSNAGEIAILDSLSVLDGTNSAVTNTGVIVVLDGMALTIQGGIVNSGEIALSGSQGGADLTINGYVDLRGAGTVALSDSNANEISGSGSFTTLINENNTIIGAGTIGGLGLILENQLNGVINGNLTNTLTIDTGDNQIFNIGLIEATNASGSVAIDSNIENNGVIEANGGFMILNQSVSGGGELKIVSGTLALVAAGQSASVTFTGSSGILELDNSQTYTGSVTGFSLSGGTKLDLVDIGFVSSGEATYVDNGKGTGGVLTVTDGTHTANVTLVGNYTGSTFTASSDGNGGTTVVDPPVPHAFVAAMAGFGAGGAAAAGSAATIAPATAPLLAAPGHGG